MLELGIPCSRCTGRDCKSEYTIRQYSDLNSVLGEVASAGCEWSWGFLLCDAGNYFILHDKTKTYSGLQCGKGWWQTCLFIEQSLLLIFKFVRGDGNKRKLMSFKKIIIIMYTCTCYNYYHHNSMHKTTKHMFSCYVLYDHICCM